MPTSNIHGSPRRFYYGLNLMDDPGNANFRSPIRMHYIRMIKYYYKCTYNCRCNTEGYGPIRIAMNVHPWLIWRLVRELVTWALLPIYHIVRMCVSNSPLFHRCQVYDKSPFSMKKYMTDPAFHH